MSDFERANTSASPPLRTWDFWETTFVALIAYGVSNLAEDFAVTVMRHGFLSSAQGEALTTPGRWVGAAAIVASLPTIAVLWVATRMARREFGEYLALNWPSPGEAARALGILVVVLVAEFVVISVFVVGKVSADPLTRVGGPGGLLMLLIGACISAPIVEEFVFRGFIFRGWSQSFLGPVGAIVLTSAVWAMIHTQYDWIGRFCIFVVGLVLGHFRWRSNSTWLAVMVHSTNNILSFFVRGPYT